MTIFWLAAFIVFAIGEAVTVGLVSVWFAVGALAALFATALGAGLWLQIAVFLGVSALALALFKPLGSKSNGASEPRLWSPKPSTTPRLRAR